MQFHSPYELVNHDHFDAENPPSPTPYELSYMGIFRSLRLTWLLPKLAFLRQSCRLYRSHTSLHSIGPLHLEANGQQAVCQELPLASPLFNRATVYLWLFVYRLTWRRQYDFCLSVLVSLFLLLLFLGSVSIDSSVPHEWVNRKPLKEMGKYRCHSVEQTGEVFHFSPMNCIDLRTPDRTSLWLTT